MLFEALSDAVLLVDAETGAILDANPAAVQLYGYPKTAFLQLTDAAVTAEHDGADSSLRGTLDRSPTRVAVRCHRRKDGTVFPVEITGSTWRLGNRKVICAVVRDITERQRVEQELGHSQKMEAIGHLAGGVAHGFRNQLTVILGYANMLLRQGWVFPEHRAKVVEIVKAAEKATRLTDELLSFGRRQMLHPQVLDLGPFLAGLLRPLQKLLGEDIRLSIRPSGRPARTRLDPDRLQKAVVHLALNARDAMPHGGELLIDIDCVELTADAPLGRDAPPGRYVRICVADTGHGMDDETRRRIFDPYFTTKDAADGTGLGLSMVYGFVRQSGGFIECSSRLGGGTRFHLHFPSLPADALAHAAPADEAPPPAASILVVEDEDMVRRFLVQTLRDAGYAVLEATGAQHALAIARQAETQIDLLIADVVMPRMNGVEVARQIRATRTQVAVLYVSGYAEDDLVRRGVQFAKAGLLVKPFGRDGLLDRVGQLLGVEKPASDGAGFSLPLPQLRQRL